MLKVSPRKGAIRFGKRGKINPQYIGPFKILERIGPVTYKLELLKELSNVYSTFHVSYLKKCLSDESLIIPMKELRLDDKLNFVEEPVEIMDREVKQLKQSHIPIVKVIWNSKRGPKFTWEREDQIRAKLCDEAVTFTWYTFAINQISPVKLPLLYVKNGGVILHDDGVENKSSSISKKAAHPLVKPQLSSIPFPNRVRKEKEEALQRKFLENLKEPDINIPFIKALFQIPKYAKYLKSLLMNKSRLEEACTKTMNESCSAVMLNELPSKEKDPRNFTIPCQVLEKHKEAEDLAADHLYRFESQHMKVLTEREIADKFSNEHLMVLKSKFKDDEPWYADFVNYIVGKVVPPNWTFEKRKRLFSQLKTYFWEEPYAFKLCADNIMRRCVAGSKTLEILAHCHSGPTGGHHSANITAKKVYESGFYWPSVFKDANEYVRRCDACQRSENISSRNEMPQNNIQTKVTNRAIKRILQRLVGYNPKDWSEKLNDALWAFRTAYKTPTGCTPFRLVYGKACHLPVEIEHKAHWALKQYNMDLTLASESHLMQLNELAELRDGDKVLLYNSRLKMYPGKLKSKWSGPNIVKTVYPHGAIEITDMDGFSFKVNGQRLKKYYGGNIDKEDDEVIELENDAMRS
ncbi:reverse transcriptase domain-containing protein [Tanacetum coccineum]